MGDIKVHKLSARAIVDDIHSGATNEELRSKYDLTPDRLARILIKLMDLQLADESNLTERISQLQSAGAADIKETEPVCYPIVRVPMHDLDDIEGEGFVQNINETSVEVAGLPSQVGSTKVFLIKPPEFEDFAGIQPFSFDAECTGVLEDEAMVVARFRITSILEKDVRELKKLVNSAMFCE